MDSAGGHDLLVVDQVLEQRADRRDVPDPGGGHDALEAPDFGVGIELEDLLRRLVREIPHPHLLLEDRDGAVLGIDVEDEVQRGVRPRRERDRVELLLGVLVDEDEVQGRLRREARVEEVDELAELARLAIGGPGPAPDRPEHEALVPAGCLPQDHARGLGLDAPSDLGLEAFLAPFEELDPGHEVALLRLER